MLAVTAVLGDRAKWKTNGTFTAALAGNPMKMLDLSQLLDHIGKMSTTTVAASQIGRVLQLMKAAEKGKKALLDAVEAQSDEAIA